MNHTHEVVTEQGAKISVIAHIPELLGKERAPGLVIAPARKYDMSRPLIAGLAEEVAKQGIVALRFDWCFYTAGRTPSEGLAHERQELEAVLAFAASHPQVDPGRLVLAGKSLGTLVAYPTFQAHPELLALLMLTPVFTWRWDDEGAELPEPRPSAAKNYPGLADTTRPIVLTLGNQDPLCSLPMLYAALAEASDNVATLVFAGDHGLNLGGEDDPAFTARNRANVQAAVQATVHWTREILQQHA